MELAEQGSLDMSYSNDPKRMAQVAYKSKYRPSKVVREVQPVDNHIGVFTYWFTSRSDLKRALRVFENHVLTPVKVIEEETQHLDGTWFIRAKIRFGDYCEVCKTKADQMTIHQL